MKWRWSGRGETHADPIPNERTLAITKVAEQVETIAQNQKEEAAELLRLVNHLRSARVVNG